MHVIHMHRLLSHTHTVTTGQTVECFNTCGAAALSLGICTSPAVCCNGGGTGFIDLSNEADGCLECSDLPKSKPCLVIYSPPHPSGTTLSHFFLTLYYNNPYNII